MGGILGRLFREFAITITAAILISGVVSVTLTPMLCSRFLKSVHQQKQPSWLYRQTERVFDAMLDVYEHSLQWVLRHRAVTLALSVLMLAGTGYLFVKIPKGFIPDSDNDQLLIQTEAEQGISFQQMSRNQQMAVELVRKDPAIASFFSGINGPSANNFSSANFGRMFMTLKPRRVRGSLDSVMSRMRQKLAGLPYIRIYVQH